MTRARRAALLLGLALVLGVLAAADVARREAALEARLGPVVERVVAARDLAGGRVLRPRDLAVRRIPERYAPVDAAISPLELRGHRLAAPVRAGAFLGPLHVRTASGAPVGRGERAIELVAAGSPEWVVPGSRVDVLVTPERRDGSAGGAVLALRGAEVLDARPARRDAADQGLRRVAATLRVTVRQAVYLAGAQARAREIRLLPRGAA